MTEQRPLRIALSAGFWRDLGTYWRAYYIGRELARRGHRVTLFCISRKSRWLVHREVMDGLEIIECPHLLNRPLISHGLGPLDIAHRAMVLWSEPFDVVHGFEYFADVTLPVLLTRQRHRFVYISDWCDWFSRGAKFGRWLRWRLLVRLLSCVEDAARHPADGVTVISRCLERHVRDLGFPPDRVLYLSGGAPVDTIQPLPKAEARARLGMNPDWQIVGYLASNHVPGMEQFVEPLVTLGQEIPTLRVLLIGHMDPVLVSLLRERGLGERLILPGFVPLEELPWYLAAADVFLIGLEPNTCNEARWPSKLGEYLAAGRPVIGSNVGDTPHVIAEGKAGFVVHSEPWDIHQKLSLVLNDTSLAAGLGQNARRVAEDKLAWSRLVDRLEHFYQQQREHSASVRAHRQC